MIQSDENFCRDCGQKATPRTQAAHRTQPTLILPQTNATRPQDAAPYTSPVTQPQASKNNSVKLVVGIIGALVLALLLIPLLIWFWLRSPTQASGAVILRLHGSNTIGAKLAPALAEEFLKQQGAKEVKRVPGKSPEETNVEGVLPGDSAPKLIEIKAYGSDTAFKDLAKGECDIGMASRKIKPEEIQQLASFGDMTSRASEHVLALDGIAVIVNADNAVAKLTKDQIARIFAGEIKDWSEVSDSRGAINVYARDDASGTFDTFKTLVFGKDRKLTGAAKRFDDSNELSKSVSSDRNGIGFVGLPFIGNAKAVAVSESGATPLKPSQFTVATEDYLLTRRLYLYMPSNSQNPLAAKFVEFALSPQGQAVVALEKFVALTLRTEKQTASKDAPDEYQDLTKDAERLSLNFRFRPGKKELDNKALRDIDLVVEILGKNKNANQKVLLMGFTDNTGNSDKNIQLSKDRAETVAEEFRQRGITPAVVTGFGAQMPVASNDSREGQEKNRRVEIWLKQ